MARRANVLIPVALGAIVIGAGTAAAQTTGFGGSGMSGWTAVANTAAQTAGLPSVSGTGTSADVLTLTNTNIQLATAYWFNTAQNITNFRESFTYTDATAGGADGIAVVWQNQGTTALGAAGGALGYAPGTGLTTGGITSAAALAMNVYSGNSGSGSQFNNTVTAGSVAITPTPGGVNLASGHAINVTLSYKESDQALTETLTDTVNNSTFTRVWRGISIQGQVGGTNAFIGLTGGTGNVTATQTVTNFQFSPGIADPTPVAAFKPITLTGFTQNMIISAASGSANLTATLDQGTTGTANTFYERGVNTASVAAGVPQAGVVFGSGTDSNHTFALAPNGAGQNDAVMLDPTHASGTLTPTSLASYSALSFLVSGANGGGNINVVVHYAGAGGTQAAAISAPDWFNGTPIAFDANGRANLATANGTFTFNNDNDGNPRMYQEDVALTDTADAVTSVDFNYGGTNREIVWGISGIQAVPEPSTLALVSVAALGLWARRRRPM